jgi:hypothetical protein
MINYDIVTIFIQQCMYMQKMLAITHLHVVSASVPFKQLT